MSAFRSRRGVLAAAIALIALPAIIAAAQATSFFSTYREDGSIVSSGVRREYVLYVPSTLDMSKPAPLVISLHGATLYGAAQREISQWDRIADAEGIIVAYPSGRRGSGPRVWHYGEGDSIEADARFIGELIDTIAAHHPVDRARVFANGLSNGGGMSFALSCLMPERIAAVGLVGAAQTSPFDWCADTHAVPMIAFHGTLDPQVPYLGGKTIVFRRPFPGVESWAARWARRNGCARRVPDARFTNVVRIAWVDCTNHADVTLYRIEGGGHTWPGGGPLPEWAVGPISQDIDASAVMWEFFRRHPLR